jgi:hypothetical protein
MEVGGQPNATTASVPIHWEAPEQVWTFFVGEEENILFLHGIEPWFVQPIASSL